MHEGAPCRLCFPCACLFFCACGRTFFDQDTDDAVRVEDEVGALGVLVADDGGASLELLGLGQEDNLLWWLIGLGRIGRSNVQTWYECGGPQLVWTVVCNWSSVLHWMGIVHERACVFSFCFTLRNAFSPPFNLVFCVCSLPCRIYVCVCGVGRSNEQNRRNRRRNRRRGKQNQNRSLLCSATEKKSGLFFTE